MTINNRDNHQKHQEQKADEKHNSLDSQSCQDSTQLEQFSLKHLSTARFSWTVDVSINVIIRIIYTAVQFV